MGRPREFDEEEVIERAGDAFWENGYEATSITDLEVATGLAKGSLYKAFKGKHDLFIRALDRYLEQGRARMKVRLDAAACKADGLADWLRTIADMATTGPVRKGCFAVNCAVELAPSDPVVRQRLAGHERHVEQLYAEAIQDGIDRGQFSAEIDPAAAARFVHGMIHGIQTLGKSSLTRDEAERLVQLTLRALT